MSWKTIPGLLKAAFLRWWAGNTFLLGAALAYYTVFALAPVVLIALAMAGLFFDKRAARTGLLQEINYTVGDRVGVAIGSVIDDSSDTDTGVFATIVAVVMLCFGATSVFAQLQDALNTIWGVQRKEGIAWWIAVKDRFWSFTIVLAFGFLLLVSLVFSAVLAALAKFVEPSALPGGTYLWQALNWLISFGLITLLFALIYKLLPDTKIDWSDVWVGAAVTALLFDLGKYLIGMYLGRSSWISSYGAAGSLVVILLWVYYSSQIFLFGAEFTYVYAHHEGKQVIPKENAEPATTQRMKSEEWKEVVPPPAA
ncbi:MAG TPA: YihY/virulence factor BrkB family protein [Gemmataceae bacterium]|nr:YihY/virulence factor BrkB family protein [Gemmataceae bacterium]